MFFFFFSTTHTHLLVCTATTWLLLKRSYSFLSLPVNYETNFSEFKRLFNEVHQYIHRYLFTRKISSKSKIFLDSKAESIRILIGLFSSQ